MTEIRKERVLVVEDSRSMALLLSRRIEAALGAEAVVAGSLAEAARLLEGGPFLAAVLDLMLPDAPRGEVVDLVLARGIPSVILTGSSEGDVRRRMFEKNIIDFVSKEDESSFDYALSVLRRIEKNRSMAVLVVDDTASSRHVVTRFLENQLFRVLEAGDGREALEVLEREPSIRLVITDYQMPGMNGQELIREIRRRRSREDLAIIGLSSAEDPELSARLLKTGANDFLAKPFGKEEFFCRVNVNLEILEAIEAQKALHERSMEEQRRAHQKQRGILVNDFEKDEAFRTRILYHPSDILSGDSYSLHRTDSGAAFLYLIDGMGHGLLPSMTSFAVSSTVRRHVATIASLEAMVASLVDMLRCMLGTWEQLSYSFFYLDPELTRLDYAIGGMFPAWVEDAGGVRSFKSNNPPIMAFMKSIRVTSVPLSGFRKLLVYSDGLVEDEERGIPFEEVGALLDLETLERTAASVVAQGRTDDTSIVYFERL